jgi:GPH family glycoside/pentoside/hexuronide:cation symporter
MTAGMTFAAPRLWPWSVFAAMIAAAGLPIYIHAPKVYAETHGLSLGALGLVLALLRLIDVVQDPFLGWLAEVTRAWRGAMVAGATALLTVSMLALFAVSPPVAPLWWFAISMTGLFSAYSFLTIVFYAQGVESAPRFGPDGHVRLAGWRESGALLGVSIAAVAPVALAGLGLPPLAAFATGFAGFAVLAGFAMAPYWQSRAASAVQGWAGFAPVLRDRKVRWLLLLALVNAAPVAITSTLFLFFVESGLGLPGWEGPLLLVFFLSAALSAPFWSSLAAQFGALRCLAFGMALAVAAFMVTLALPQGALLPFALISAASGAAVGADMVLLPALFARRLAVLGQGEAAGFGLWSFASKLALALAAAALLPLLGVIGFVPGGANNATVLEWLNLLYAGLPCALKLLALALLPFIPSDRE